MPSSTEDTHKHIQADGAIWKLTRGQYHNLREKLSLFLDVNLDDFGRRVVSSYENLDDIRAEEHGAKRTKGDFA